MQAGIDQALITAGQRGQSGDEVAVIEGAVSAGTFGESVGEPHDQVLMLVHKLVADLDLQKKSGGIEAVVGSGFLMLASLLQVRTVAGAVERNLALFAATLRADAAMHGRAKPLLLSDLANGAGHEASPIPLWHPALAFGRLSEGGRKGAGKLLGWPVPKAEHGETGMFCALLGTPY
jgi:hypothetical protein